MLTIPRIGSRWQGRGRSFTVADVDHGYAYTDNDPPAHYPHSRIALSHFGVTYREITDTEDSSDTRKA